MIETTKLHHRILQTIQGVLDTSDELVKGVDILCDIMYQAHNIFVIGAGRSGLVAKMFVMRLRHLGLPAFVPGEVSTPRVQWSDFVLALSNSGNTTSVRDMCVTANQVGSKVWLITANPQSTIGKIATRVFTVNSVPLSQKNHRSVNFMPLGSTFELSVLTFLESVVGYLIEKSSVTEETLQARHTNLE